MSHNPKKTKRDWLWLAPAYFDRWRVFPRMFILAYFWLLYTASTWFMALGDPGTAQSTFISVVVGAGAAWFGLYVNSHKSQDGGQSPYHNPPSNNPHFGDADDTLPYNEEYQPEPDHEAKG